MDNTIKERQAKLRERRQAAGWRRVETWLPPEAPTMAQVKAELLKLAKDLDATKLSAETALALAKAKIWELAEAMAGGTIDG